MYRNYTDSEDNPPKEEGGSFPCSKFNCEKRFDKQEFAHGCGFCDTGERRNPVATLEALRPALRDTHRHGKLVISAEMKPYKLEGLSEQYLENASTRSTRMNAPIKNLGGTFSSHLFPLQLIYGSQEPIHYCKNSRK